MFLGDIVGRAGRALIQYSLPEIRQAHSVDFVVANAENATHGLGLSAGHAIELLASGVDCITLGDHAFDQQEMLSFIEREPRILRPVNLTKGTPGAGFRVFDIERGRKVLVLCALGRVFMGYHSDDPFAAIDSVLAARPIKSSVDAIIVDFHAEATSEKAAMGHFCDGRVSLLAGTHTHVPTSDHRVLSGGTAFISDAGMCGDYDSVIGVEKTEPLHRFTTGLRKGRFRPAIGPANLCGVIVDIDATSGFAKKIQPFWFGHSEPERGHA